MNLNNIELKYTENTKPDSKWQFDQIDAYMGDTHLGYVRVAYINETTVQELLKDPLFLVYDVLCKEQLYTENYIRTPEGQTLKTYLPKYYDQAHYVAWLLYRDHDLQSQRAQIETWDDEQLREYVSNHSAQIFKKCLKNKHLRNHAEYHFCRPDIDYIQVLEAYQKNGIGAVLYRAASKWMNEKGMVLHSSTLQQDGAVRSWEKMKKNGEADVLQIKGHTHPRYRYIKDVDPKWLSDKIIFKTAKIKTDRKPKKISL